MSIFKENISKIHDIQINFFKNKGYCVNSDGLISINKLRLFDDGEIENILRCVFEIQQLFKKSNSQFGLSSTVGKYAIDKWRQIKKNVIYIHHIDIDHIHNELDKSKINSVDIEITKGEFIIAMLLSGYNSKVLKKNSENITVFFDASVIKELKFL